MTVALKDQVRDFWDAASCGEIYAQGDCARAIGVADMMQMSVDGWQGKYADPDIDGDNQVLLKLRQNVVDKCAAQGPITPIQPVGMEGGCMML